MHKKSILSSSAKETKQIGEVFGREIVHMKPLARARVIGLRGDLGAGKTTFIQGMLRGLGIRKRTTSPTFVLIKRFSIKNETYKNFFHIDAYRLSSFEELYPLEIQKILEDPHAIICIEWIENIQSKKLHTCGMITFTHKKEKRLITISPC